ncbi:cytochrome P450 [Phanerochaete sordida]|uniref:Cytochrome P450 n=1 Tax=Phanerochaete sordida TaxID=48140 RepID=A0A9P3GBG0_9APHY|nr:cytochrome P450 [Phanerochaete sordida]
MSDPESLNAFYRNPDRGLVNGLLHSPVPRLLGDVQSPHAGYMIESTLVPIIVKGNAEPSLCEIAAVYNAAIYRTFQKLAAGGKCQSLWSLVTGALFQSVLPTMFGPSFPLRIYDDVLTLDKSTYQLFHSIPLLPRSVPRARLRVRDALKGFMRPWKDVSADIPDVSAHGNDVLRALFALALTDDDRAGLLQTYIWGVLTNLFRLTYWLLAHLLCDRAAYCAQLQAAVDVGVAATFPDPSELLHAHPRAVNGSHFALVDAAMKEAARLHLLPLSHRVARADVALQSARGPFVVPAGSTVVAYTPGAHLDPARFDEPGAFRLDRFVGGAGVRNLYVWSKGAHICPGRHMAMYYLKMFVIVLLHRFDLVVEGGTSGPCTLPTGNPWITGLPLPRKDLLVSVKMRT